MERPAVLNISEVWTSLLKRLRIWVKPICRILVVGRDRLYGWEVIYHEEREGHTNTEDDAIADALAESRTSRVRRHDHSR